MWRLPHTPSPFLFVVLTPPPSPMCTTLVCQAGDTQLAPVLGSKVLSESNGDNVQYTLPPAETLFHPHYAIGRPFWLLRLLPHLVALHLDLRQLEAYALIPVIDCALKHSQAGIAATFRRLEPIHCPFFVFIFIFLLFITKTVTMDCWVFECRSLTCWLYACVCVYICFCLFVLWRKSDKPVERPNMGRPLWMAKGYCNISPSLEWWTENPSCVKKIPILYNGLGKSIVDVFTLNRLAFWSRW